MQRLHAGPILPLRPSADPLARLRPWPGVLARLVARGVVPARLPGEDAPAHEDRLGTALMALYRDEGGAAAFEALYALSRDGVARWIRGLLARSGRRLDPAELLQDTYVNVYRYPSAFRDEAPSSFRVWVRTIAGNVVRRAGTRGRRLPSLQDLPAGLQEPEDERGGPAWRAQAGEERRRLQAAWTLFLLHYARAWTELRERDRRALHLVEVEGRSYAEAGEILGVGRSNMKMIVFRARLRIARRMRAAMELRAAA